MDSCLTHSNPNFLSSRTFRSSITFGHRRQRVDNCYTRKSKQIRCGINAPLEPITTSGKLVSDALFDGCDELQAVAGTELKALAADRDAALARMRLSVGSDQACLHRRIAELKRIECQKAVEDIMYILALHKFSEIGVYLVPSLVKCVSNGRLEICPVKTWELESIYSSEALEIVREHLNGIIGFGANSNISESWATTEIRRGRLCQLYAASLLFGYFLKSACLRYQLESGLKSIVYEQMPVLESILGTYMLGISKNTAFGCVTSPRFASVDQLLGKEESLRAYVAGFDPDVIEMCAKPKSRELMDLIQRHSCALFGCEETDTVILTSFASVKRFVLEAVAFGYFLWDIESWVDTVCTLEENREV